MPAKHILVELRTGRDSQHTPESASQLFAALPSLKNQWWLKLLGQDERLSFELVVEYQQIFFQCYIPARLFDYMKGAISGSYPEVFISKIETDSLDELHKSIVDQNQPPTHIELGSLTLANHDYLPLKTYQEFKDVDSITPLLSTLSKLTPEDKVVIQYLLKSEKMSWKTKGDSILSRSSRGETSEHPQKRLIQSKLDATTVQTSIRVAVAAGQKNRSRLLLETVAAPFQSVANSSGNQLRLRRVLVFKSGFLKAMTQRSSSRAKFMHLSTDELATILHLPNHSHSSIPNIAWGKTLLGEPPENLPVKDASTPDELKGEINAFAKTMYKNQATVYGVKRTDRRRHMYVIGKTGTGKSTLLSNMAINDLKNGEGLCVVDPHGDLVETLLNYIPSNRINDVIYFNPADQERTVQINLFEGDNYAHRELIASGIISIFQKLYGYSWGPRLEYILRNSLLTLLKTEKAKLSDILELLTNPKFREKIVENLDDPILKSYWENEYNRMPERLRTESIASILNKVGQFVSSPLVRNVVNAETSSFSIEKIMDEGKILLVNLSQGRLGEDNATLLGAMIITKIQLAAMNRVSQEEDKRRDFYLYVDEFQNFATDVFSKILSEARKYRLSITLANQYVAQIPEEVQRAIFGNCGNIISFVMGADDAEVFANEYGNLYTQDDLVSLGRYQIVNKISIDSVISRPFPADTLGLAKSSNQNRDKVIMVSRERYARKKKQ